MSSKCPKCGAKLSPFYLKDTCPSCGVNLVYYDLENRLKADAAQAKKEVDAVNHFLDILKKSTISSPVLIVRLIMFFLPLAPMCLKMYGDLSLISLIMGIIGGDFDIGANIMPIISMALIIVLSLVVIISSLFSSTKTGLVRNVIFSIINLGVFVGLGLVIGGMGIGWYITLALLVLDLPMHLICNNSIKKKD